MKQTWSRTIFEVNKNELFTKIQKTIVELDEQNFIKLTADENTKALNTIAEVGPSGDFLSTDHTLENCRSEIWTPHLIERRDWSSWEKDGRKDIEQRAIEKTKEILASHHPARLSPDIEAEIDRIARDP